MKIAWLVGVFYDGMLNSILSEHTHKFFLQRKDFNILNDCFLNCGIVSEKVNDDNQLFELLKEFEPCVIISIGWRKILKTSFFDVFSNCLLINVHPAILPTYRGYHTEPFIIMNGEQYHGITAHILTEELDSGGILLQETFEIGKFSTVKSIKSLVQERMPHFIKKLLDMVYQGNVQPSCQKGPVKIVAPKRTPLDSCLNPNLTLIELFDFIRACDPEDYPAFFYLHGEKVFIKIWSERMNKKPFEI